MGYRLYATIPNINYSENFLELGKQYDRKWDDFNNFWFGEFDGGLIHPADLSEFLSELKKVNNQPGEYELYNIELLEEMIQHAILYDYSMFFVSY